MHNFCINCALTGINIIIEKVLIANVGVYHNKEAPNIHVLELHSLDCFDMKACNYLAFGKLSCFTSAQEKETECDNAYGFSY